MAPLKFEDNLKDKLRGREIEPSKQAWEKIAAQLEAPKKKKRDFIWYGIAASFMGLLLLSVWFFNQNNNALIEPQVVETNSEDRDTVPKVLESIKKNEGLVETTADKSKTEKTEAVSPVKTIKKEKKPFQKSQTVIAKTDVKLEKFQVEKSPIVKDEIGIKVSEIIAEVTNLKDINTKVTDDEVDALLRRAQKQILTEKALASGLSVDAMVLLTEAESELDESFRDQIFEALKSGYLKVKTVVADRNN